MKPLVIYSELHDGQRVYVKDLDVFGRVSPYMTRVICEAPMPGHEYMITDRSILYDANAMEGRMITTSGRIIPLPPTDAAERRQWKTRYFADLYGASQESIRKIVMEGMHQQESHVHRPPPRIPSWIRFVAYRILAPIGIIAALVYIFSGCAKQDPETKRAIDRLQETYQSSCVEHTIPPEMLMACVSAERELHNWNRL